MGVIKSPNLLFLFSQPVYLHLDLAVLNIFQ